MFNVSVYKNESYINIYSIYNGIIIINIEMYNGGSISFVVMNGDEKYPHMASLEDYKFQILEEINSNETNKNKFKYWNDIYIKDKNKLETLQSKVEKYTNVQNSYIIIYNICGYYNFNV
ncbi:Hypothetical protein ORPV_943 [Orpheovirus IHUMI-LCC2]|uniref:Uncharacterized protein n=1 Tax=Orpheovirus IHUMI-LCC2 TaxID=2023057 RepID=A0A2I2L5P2_9VIRU|nr:Hypothetical protein ORPV_943 [Orpheovirus IHUMI-LCC2]SNW62847.1 Hypothetical protein ORPV_943 [Orpheovirus IHUMI-LCC2]